MKIKTISVLLLLIIMLPGTVSGAYAVDPDKAGSKWTASFSDPYFMGTSMTSTPVVTENTVYVINRDVLFALRTSDGKKLWQLLLPLRMNSVCDPAFKDHKLYIPLSEGVICCVDVETKTICWSSENHGGQTLGRLFFHKGLLYAGTWEAARESSKGVFFCVDSADGATRWTYEDMGTPCGYYWTQAACITDHLYFTSEDGRLIIHDLASDRVYGIVSLTDGAALRNGLTADIPHNRLFTVSKDGTVICIRINEDGSVREIKKAPLMPDARHANSVICTSTPSLYENNLYVGCAADGYGYLCILNADTLQTVDHVRGVAGGEIKSSPLILDDHSTAATGIAVYVTANEPSGSLYEYRSCDPKPVLTRLFAPFSAKQYCLSNVVGRDDILFYSNDSGTLFAIGDVPVSSDIPALKAPTNLKYNKKKAYIRLTWKCQSIQGIHTQVCIKTVSGKWKTITATGRTSYRIKKDLYKKHIRKKRKIRIRIRTMISHENRNYYSDWTGITIS